MDESLPQELSIDWLTNPHPDLADLFMTEVKTGWTVDTVLYVWGPIFPFSILLSLLFAVGIVYCVIRILQIRRAEYLQFHKASHSVAARDVPRTHLRWNRVLEHANSNDEHQWRLAILEADIMLNELLDSLGYKGETMAEKMKQVSRGDFNSIDSAWEAHKVRNRVAHEGAESPLTEREKNRVIGLYSQIFKEFKFIP